MCSPEYFVEYDWIFWQIISHYRWNLQQFFPLDAQTAEFFNLFLKLLLCPWLLLAGCIPIIWAIKVVQKFVIFAHIVSTSSVMRDMIDLSISSTSLHQGFSIHEYHIWKALGIRGTAYQPIFSPLESHHSFISAHIFMILGMKQLQTFASTARIWGAK